MSRKFKRSFNRAGAYLVSCSNSGSDNVPRGRDSAKITGAQGVLEAGTVLGQITATKVYTKHNPTAADGSEKASAILFGTLDTGDAGGAATPVDCTIDRMDIAVHGGYLVLAEGITAPQIVTLIADLDSVGIVIRNKSDLA